MHTEPSLLLAVHCLVILVFSYLYLSSIDFRLLSNESTNQLPARPAWQPGYKPTVASVGSHQSHSTLPVSHSLPTSHHHHSTSPTPSQLSPRFTLDTRPPPPGQAAQAPSSSASTCLVPTCPTRPPSSAATMYVAQSALPNGRGRGSSPRWQGLD